MRLKCLILIFLFTGVGGCASVSGIHTNRPTIMKTEIVEQDDADRHIFINLLRNVDPENQTSNDRQALSLYGREDLVAKLYRKTPDAICQSLIPQDMAVSDFSKILNDTNIVIVSEDHVTTRHRAFTLDLAVELSKRGWKYFAAEAFINLPTDAPIPADQFVDARPQELFFRTTDGSYIQEAQFGRLGRVVKELEYRLIPYEYFRLARNPEPTDRVERINQRDSIQAENLMAAVLRDDPDAKILIHVGLGHAAERPIVKQDGREVKWLAYRLKELTGRDPLTISQHSCLSASGEVEFAKPASNSESLFDLYVLQPEIEFAHGRPAWRLERGDIPVDIPSELIQGSTGWRIIEARPVGEPDESVAMDMVAVWKEETISLLLPPGEYVVRAIKLDETNSPKGQSR